MSEGNDLPSPRAASWSSLTGAANWLRSSTPFKTTGLPKSLTGSGLPRGSPSEVIPKLGGFENRTRFRQSGTSVDKEVHEFITPVVSTANYAMKPRSFPDGNMRRLSLTDHRETDTIRETMENLSEEMERQKLATERLQNCVDLHQKLIKDLLNLEEKVNLHERCLTQREEQNGNSTLSGVLCFFSMICNNLLSSSMLHLQYIFSFLNKEQMKIWLNKCLRLFMSFLLYVLFKSWLQLLGFEEVVIKIENMVLKAVKLLLIPFTSRTGSLTVKPTGKFDRDKGMR